MEIRDMEEAAFAAAVGRGVFEWIDNPEGIRGIQVVLGRDGRYYKVTVEPMARRCGRTDCVRCYG